MRGTWLAQLEKRVTLDLMVVSSSPTVGVDVTYLLAYIHT